MGVYIPDLKMPKDCIGCMSNEKTAHLCSQEEHQQIIQMIIRHGGNYKNPNCKLVEIPTPHGRLIDAEWLCNGLMDRWDIADKNKEQLVRDVMADIVTPIVVSMPTVLDAEE